MLAELENLAIAKGDDYKREASDADAIEAFLSSSHYNVLEELVFKKIESQAFSTLKNPTLDMTDLNQLYQLRALCQAIDLIRKQMNQIVAQGKNARLFLKKLNSTQGESNE